jgi:thiol-disulfide isomerase/thioredoxin
MLVAFMGTWCPNCADEAPFLRDLYAKYGPKGLEVISLSFEYTDDVERNRRQVKRFIERFGTRHPILLAGTTKGAAASPAILPLEGWEGYPTTLFLDRRHRIVKIHSGFDGPATGERFAKLKKEIEGAVEMLLSDPEVVDEAHDQIGLERRGEEQIRVPHDRFPCEDRKEAKYGEQNQSITARGKERPAHRDERETGTDVGGVGGLSRT